MSLRKIEDSMAIPCSVLSRIRLNNDYAEENPKPKVRFNYPFSMTDQTKASA
jgi:hypothetical protein